MSPAASIRYHRHAASQINDVAILKATVTLTNAQIKALPTTAIEIVPAPDSGQVNIPVAVIVTTDTSAAAYTNIGVDAYLFIGTDAADWCYPAANESGSHVLLTALLGVANKYILLNTAASQVPISGWGIVANPVLLTQADGKSLNVKISGNSGALTGGNTANSMTVAVCYMVIDI